MEEMTFEEFSREVNNIYKKNCEVYYKLASHFGMTETMFDILYFVRENDGGYTQVQLCESLHLRKQTVNSALKKLEKDGVICLSQDSGNKKSKTIHFTEKGKELAQSTEEIRKNTQEKFYLCRSDYPIILPTAACCVLRCPLWLR